MSAAKHTPHPPEEHSTLTASEAPRTLSRAPAEWLDRLLAGSNAVPPTASPAQAARRLLDAVGGALEGVALGVSVPQEGGANLIVRGADPRAPKGTSEPPESTASTHPERLFPDRAHEVVYVLDLTPHAEASLYVATDEGVELSAAMLDRLGATMTSTLRRSLLLSDALGAREGTRMLEAQMIHAERLASVGQIAASIVHDLNNPLTTIVAYSEYLRRRWERSPPEVTNPSAEDAPADSGGRGDLDRLVRIHEAAERLLGFTRDLMTYARPSTHVPAAVNIHEVLDRAVGFCEHLLVSTGTEIDKAYGARRAIRGISGQLVQVFVNLLTNACHAVGDVGGGVVELRTEVTDSFVSVTIADDGKGIPRDVAKRIFEPFFTTKAEGTGTGLGLSIVRRIVEAHGGSVDVEPNEPRGARFIVRLPVAKTVSEAPPAR